MKKITQLFALIGFSLGIAKAQTQPDRHISGRISADGQPLDHAAVYLLKAGDSSLVKGTLSSAKGIYLMDHLPAGQYFIKVTAVGYQKTSSTVFNLSPEQPAIEMPELVLKAAVQLLTTVNVTGAKPVIERKTDRMVMNVQNSLLSAGNSALEILARAPGVTIDKDDNISLNGLTGVNVIINGKMTYLAAVDLANLLRSTDGHNIASIELMTNPSSKYDASGMAGIINIKLKKNTNTGTNGTLTAGAGYGKYTKENTALSLSHRQGNLSVFTNFSHSDSKNEFNINQQRVVTDSVGSKTFFNQHSKTERISHNNAYRVGADLTLGRYNTLGVLINGYFNDAGSSGRSLTGIIQSLAPMVSDQDQLTSKNLSNKNFSLNLNDLLKLDSLGQELSIDMDYSRFTNRSDAEYNTAFSLPDGTITAPPVSFRQQTPSLINIRTAKLDYVLPLKNQGQLEAGMKYSDVATTNELDAQRRMNNSYINDPALTNQFIYEEKIAAGYLNYSLRIHLTSLQAGLRAEHTGSDGQLINSGRTVKRRYLDLFPDITVNQKINDKNDIGITYSRRIDRPGYDKLNPFTYYLDQYSYNQGNPFLNPQYTGKIGVNYTYDHDLNVELGFSRTSDYLANLALTNPVTQMTAYTTMNLQRHDYFDIAVNSPYQINRWWNGNMNSVFYCSSFRSDNLLGGNFHQGQVALQIQATQYFLLAKNYKAEVFANYESPFIEDAYRFSHIIYTDLGISHSFAAKKASLKLSVTDLLNTKQTTMISKFQTNDITLHLKQESRVARLTFTYNFGAPPVKSRQRHNGSEDERSRAAS